MFGNRLGWSLSLVIVALTGPLIDFLHEWDKPQSPTAMGQNAVKYTLSLPVDARSLGPYMVDEPDAGEVYRKAMLDDRRNEPLYDLMAPHAHPTQRAARRNHASFSPPGLPYAPINPARLC